MQEKYDTYKATVTYEDGTTEVFDGWAQVSVGDNFTTFIWAEGDGVSVRTETVSRIDSVCTTPEDKPKPELTVIN